MQDNVKYQIERAEDALRTALNLGSASEDPYLLRNIADTISTINSWKTNVRFSVSNFKPYLGSPSPYPDPTITLTDNNINIKTSIPSRF
jgi:hypothetical protein